jgi:D-glucosaminate-6-phosphate ammonia-lyase
MGKDLLEGSQMSVYRELGLTPIINACGPVTRLGGAPLHPAALDAFVAAAAEAVPLEQLQAVASLRIAALTGAEAGLVTAGAAASLTLGTAAILAGWDVGRMERLPQCDGFPHEFVIAREHRNGYDHAVRAAGARLIEVGFNEITAHAGVRRTESWEYQAAFGPHTAGVLYGYALGTRPPLEEVVSVARGRGIPVLVDAAAELPPRENLRRILATGADLVAFSGGKALRGPQSTGLLCGRGDLIASAALQMLDMDDHPSLWDPPASLIDRSRLNGMPRHGIGRGLKVSKEEIVGLLKALELFAAGVLEPQMGVAKEWLKRIAAALAASNIGTQLVGGNDQSWSSLEITVDEGRLRKSAFDVCRRLRNGNPPVYVGHGSLADARLVVRPQCLGEDQIEPLISRLTKELTV